MTYVGNLLHDLKMYEEALTYYSLAFERNPESYQILNNIGNFFT